MPRLTVHAVLALVALVLGLALATAGARGGERTAVLAVVSFNVESDRDTDPALVADDIAAIGRAHAVDLFGLAEVRDMADLAIFAKAAERPGAPFAAVLAHHGEQDRVALLYNAAALELRESFELERLPGSRKALVGRFWHRATELEFLFAVNHFNRRGEDRRNRQARLIRDWVLAHDLPAILTGDHNFDYDPQRREGNAAFDIFTTDPGLVWLQPPCVAAGTCPATGTQCDGRYNSIMDFVFVADRGRGWRGRSAILMQQPNYCERERRGYADHRPVLGVVELR